MTLANPVARGRSRVFRQRRLVATRAYGIGLNGLYINVQGREMSGAVAPGDRERVMDEIAGKLLQTIDPATGQRAITKVYRREQVYTDAGSSIARPISSSATRRARAARMSLRSEAFRLRSSWTTRMPGAATTAWITRRCPACCCRTGRCASPRRHSTRSPRRSWQSSAIEEFPVKSANEQMTD